MYTEIWVHTIGLIFGIQYSTFLLILGSLGNFLVYTVGILFKGYIVIPLNPLPSPASLTDV